MKYPFLNKKDGKVFFNSLNGKLEIYLPKSYFVNEQAEECGETISTLAIFVMRYYKNSDSSKFESYQVIVPETIVFSFSEETDSFKGKLSNKIDEDDYRVFVLYDGDTFLENIEVPQSGGNIEKFVKLHYAGKIPSSVKYSDILSLYFENMITNGKMLGIPSLILEAMIGELARDKNNEEIAFRKAIGKDTTNKITEYDYKQVSIKDLALINSTFTAISSENINKALTYSIEKSRTGGTEVETPIEKTMKY